MNKLAALKSDALDPNMQNNERALSIMQVEIDKLQRIVDDTQIDLDFCNKFTVESFKAQRPPDEWPYKVGMYFDYVITACIMVNIAFMCTTHYNESDGWKTVKKTQNILFLLVFIF